MKVLVRFIEGSVTDVDYFRPYQSGMRVPEGFHVVDILPEWFETKYCMDNFVELATEWTALRRLLTVYKGYLAIIDGEIVEAEDLKVCLNKKNSAIRHGIVVYLGLTHGEDDKLYCGGDQTPEDLEEYSTESIVNLISVYKEIPCTGVKHED